MIVGSQLKNAQIECLTSTQIGALHANDCVDGRIVFDTTNKKLFFYNTSTDAWVEVGTKDIDDLNNYYTKTALDAAGTGRYTKTEANAQFTTQAEVEGLTSLASYTTTTNSVIKYSKKQHAGVSSTTFIESNTTSTELADLRYENVPAGFYRLTFETLVIMTGLNATDKDALFNIYAQTDSIWTSTDSPTVEIFGSPGFGYSFSMWDVGTSATQNFHIPVHITAYFTLAGTENIYISGRVPVYNASSAGANQAKTWALLEKLPLHTATTDWDS